MEINGSPVETQGDEHEEEDDRPEERERHRGNRIAEQKTKKVCFFFPHL